MTKFDVWWVKIYKKFMEMDQVKMMNDIDYICWKIWKMSREMVIEKKYVSIHEAILRIRVVVNKFHDLTKDMDMVKSNSDGDNNKELKRWKRPEDRWVKVNCDGAFDSLTKIDGTRVIVENNDSVMMNGINKKKMVVSAFMAEALVLKMEVIWLLRKNWHKVILEINLKEL